MIPYFIQQNDVQYLNWNITKGRTGIITYGKERIKITGGAKITLTRGSKKFGDQVGQEVQFQVYTHRDNNAVVKEPRVKYYNGETSPWETVEIHLLPEDIDSVIEKLKEIKLIVESNKSLKEYAEEDRICI